MRIKNILELAAAVLLALPHKVSQAQVKSSVISGIVISREESSPLEGATVKVKRTKNLTGTMPDGAFSIPAAPGDTIIVSHDGYETNEIIVSAETYYEISLKPSVSASLLMSYVEFEKKLINIMYC